MTVVNLQPGGIFNVAANQIRRHAHVYRTGQGYAAPGNVGWEPNGGALQINNIAVGETVTFAVNGQAGRFASGSPSVLQVMWSNEHAHEAETVPGLNAQSILSRKPSPAKHDAAAVSADSASATDPGSDILNNLNAQWYNALVANLGLEDDFQLWQANTPLGSTSQQVWQVFDVVPPMSINNIYNPSEANVFSTDYGSIIANLKTQNANKFQQDMGDYYASWTAYLKTNPTLPQGGITQLFYNWSQMNMPPDQAQQCYTDWQQVSQGTVPAAMNLWLASGGASGTKAYNVTIDQIKTLLSQSLGRSFAFTNGAESSDVSHTWAQGSISGFYDIFWGKAEAGYDHLTQAFFNSSLSINAKFNSVLTVPAGPLSRPSSDPTLSQYQPWYSSAALNLAYANNNNLVWNNVPPTWDNAFGANGFLLRTCSALVLVDGIDVTITSATGLSNSDQQQFQAAASAGVWPFFTANAAGGWSNASNFDANGNLTLHITSPQGNPQILGANVTPIAAATLL